VTWLAVTVNSSLFLPFLAIPTDKQTNSQTSRCLSFPSPPSPSLCLCETSRSAHFNSARNTVLLSTPSSSRAASHARHTSPSRPGPWTWTWTSWSSLLRSALFLCLIPSFSPPSHSSQFPVAIAQSSLVWLATVDPRIEKVTSHFQAINHQIHSLSDPYGVLIFLHPPSLNTQVTDNHGPRSKG
jgi:hypothetical protein